MRINVGGFLIQKESKYSCILLAIELILVNAGRNGLSFFLSFQVHTYKYYVDLEIGGQIKTLINVLEVLLGD